VSLRLKLGEHYSLRNRNTQAKHLVGSMNHILSQIPYLGMEFEYMQRKMHE